MESSFQWKVNLIKTKCNINSTVQQAEQGMLDTSTLPYFRCNNISHWHFLRNGKAWGTNWKTVFTISLYRHTNVSHEFANILVPCEFVPILHISETVTGILLSSSAVPGPFCSSASQTSLSHHGGCMRHYSILQKQRPDTVRCRRGVLSSVRMFCLYLHFAVQPSGWEDADVRGRALH